MGGDLGKPRESVRADFWRRRYVVAAVWVAVACICSYSNVAHACSGSTDVNCDDRIDGLDLAVVANPLNYQKVDPADPRADVNGDGQVDGLDIARIAADMRCFGNAAPVADAGSDLLGVVGEPIAFSALGSFDPEGVINEYTWDFGDGATSFNATDEHVYGSAGTYTVSLTVADNCGNVDSHSIQVVVEQSGLVSADFQISPDPAEIKNPVAFSAYADPSEVLMYLWSFSDGGGGYGQSVSHAFDYAGTYTATLTVITLTGDTLNQSKQFVVSQGLSLVDVIESDRITVPRSIALHDGTVWAVGDLQAIATTDAGLDSDDVVNTGEANLYGEPLHVAANDQVVAVAAGWNGIFLYDPMTPLSLTPLGHYSTFDDDGSSATHVVLNGDILYAVAGGAIKIFDVTELANPVYVTSWGSSGLVLRADIIGDRLYVYDLAVGGCRILDITTDPYNPVQIGFVSTEGLPRDFAVSNDLLVFAEGGDGVEVFDVSNQGSWDNPVRIATRSYSTVNDGARGVALYGSKLYVSYSSRIDVFSLANPSSPQFIQWVSLGRMVHELAQANGHLFASVSQGVVAVLKP